MKPAKVTWARVCQLFFLLLFLVLFILTEYRGSDRISLAVNSFFRADPLVALSYLLAEKSFTLLLLPAALLALATLLFGRFFCGWICPLGTLGEWSATLGRRLGIRRRELPEAVDRSLRALKYLVLAVVVGLAWRTGSLAWRDVDPWVAAMHATEG